MEEGACILAAYQGLFAQRIVNGWPEIVTTMERLNGLSRALIGKSISDVLLPGDVNVVEKLLSD